MLFFFLYCDPHTMLENQVLQLMSARMFHPPIEEERAAWRRALEGLEVVDKSVSRVKGVGVSLDVSFAEHEEWEGATMLRYRVVGHPFEAEEGGSSVEGLPFWLSPNAVEVVRHFTYMRLTFGQGWSCHRSESGSGVWRTETVLTFVTSFVRRSRFFHVSQIHLSRFESVHSFNTSPPVRIFWLSRRKGGKCGVAYLLHNGYPIQKHRLSNPDSRSFLLDITCHTLVEGCLAHESRLTMHLLHRSVLQDPSCGLWAFLFKSCGGVEGEGDADGVADEVRGGVQGEEGEVDLVEETLRILDEMEEKERAEEVVSIADSVEGDAVVTPFMEVFLQWRVDMRIDTFLLGLENPFLPEAPQQIQEVNVPADRILSLRKATYDPRHSSPSETGDAIAILTHLVSQERGSGRHWWEEAYLRLRDRSLWQACSFMPFTWEQYVWLCFKSAGREPVLYNDYWGESYVLLNSGEWFRL